MYNLFNLHPFYSNVGILLLVLNIDRNHRYKTRMEFINWNSQISNSYNISLLHALLAGAWLCINLWMLNNYLNNFV